VRSACLLAGLLWGATAVLNAQAPAIDPARTVENGASFVQGQPVAPGSLVSIFGSNFASSFALFDSIPLSNRLNNVSVTFNNIPAPMVAVVPKSFNPALTSDQLNVQLPWDVLPAGAQTGTAQVVVTANGVASAPVTIPVISAAPGLFDIGTDSTGVHRPSAYNGADGTLPMPPGVVFPGFQSRPAKIGDPQALVIFATGLGPVTVTPPNGAPPPTISTTVTVPTVLVGGVPAQVIFSGLSPQYPFFNQLNVILQPGTPTGNAVPLQIQMNGITTSDQLKIAVSN